jgi:hypothetical protein
MGCFIPLKQWKFLSDRSLITAQYSEVGYFEVWVNQSNWAGNFQLIEDKSYARDPHRKRHGIRVVEKGKTQNGEIVFDIIVIDDDKNDIRCTKNGIWYVSLIFKKVNQVKVRDFGIKLWDFYYNPILHGPPN